MCDLGTLSSQTQVDAQLVRECDGAGHRHYPGRTTRRATDRPFRGYATRQRMRPIPLTHTPYERLSAGGGNGWRVSWRADMSQATPGVAYYLYQNVRTALRELDADGDVTERVVYQFCEVWKVPCDGGHNVRASAACADAFEDCFVVPYDWRARAGRIVVTAQCWVEPAAPGASFRRIAGGRGLWGTLRGRHELRAPAADACVMTRRFRASWDGGACRARGDDLVLRHASIGAWDGTPL